MIERQLGERGAGIRVAEDGRDLLGGKQTAEKLGEKLRGTRRELGGFQHHAVAGGERRDQRHDRQLERIVPRADDAHDSDRLVENAGARGHELETHGDALGRHPARQMPDRVPDRRERRPHIGEQRLVARAVAEIGGDLQGDPLGVFFDRAPQSSQIGAALLERRRSCLQECLALSRQDILHRFEAFGRASLRHADHAHCSRSSFGRVCRLEIYRKIRRPTARPRIRAFCASGNRRNVVLPAPAVNAVGLE